MTIDVHNDFEFGSTYQDDVTGFVGVLTGYCSLAHTEDEVLLENEQGTRWVSVTRVHLVKKHA